MEVEEVKEEEVDHFVYETDNWDSSIMNAVWFGKKIPGKRNVGVMLRRNMTSK
jgi:hypothetical protein